MEEGHLPCSSHWKRLLCFSRAKAGGAALVGGSQRGGGRRMRGNWGMNSWKIVVYARCAGSLQVGLLERKVHATTVRQRALQHWDFGTPRISFSSHTETKGFQQRPPPEKSLKLASCQTRPVASLFGNVSAVIQNAFSWGGVKTYGVAGISVGGGGRRMVGVNVWSKEGGGKTYQIFGLQKSKAGPIQNPEQSSTIACTELCFAPGWLW